MRRRTPGPRGVTLAEILVVAAVIGILAAVGSGVVTSFAKGQRNVSVRLPVRKAIMAAFQSTQEDLMSSGRGSLGNPLIGGGFEGFPLPLATSPGADKWSWTPTRINPLAPATYSRATINSGVGGMVTGQAGLRVATFALDFKVLSPTFTLTGGMVYGAAVWSRRWTGSGGRTYLEVLGDGANPPVTVVQTTFTVGVAPWHLLQATFTAVGGNIYQIQLRVHNNASPVVQGDDYDEVTLTPQFVDLSPGDGQAIYFDRYDALTGRRDKCRYRLLAQNGTGRLVRERYLNQTWAPFAGPLDGIRRLGIAWTRNLSTDFLAFGTDQPIALTFEAGPLVSAVVGDTVAFTTEIYPPTP